MGKRIPQTRADKALNKLLGAYPELRRLPEDVASMDMNFALAERICGALYPRGAVGSSGMIPYELLKLWAAWRHCRQVYRFDRRLSQELREMELPGDMPTEALKKLPYPIMYVDAPFDVPFGNGTALPCCEFFVLQENLVWPRENKPDRILIYCDFGEKPTYCTTISLEGGTLARATSEIIDRNLISWREDHIPILTQGISQFVSVIFNYLLYIASDRCEQEVVYTPSNGSKRTRRAAQSTVHEVGAYIGRRLGAARSKSAPTSAPAVGTGRSPRPHIRAAHWHHYWTGPLSGPRELKLRWVEPIFVGPKSQIKSTVVHEAWEQDRLDRGNNASKDVQSYEDHEDR